MVLLKKDNQKIKQYSLEESIILIKRSSYAKFNETIDIAINLGVDTRHSDQMVRGVTFLPAGTGKDVKVAVICKEDKKNEAKEAGADIVDSTEIINNIKAGRINFDICISTPDMMGLVGQVARILGPKGLMPNPKLGTVSMDIKTAIKNAKSGRVEYRVEKAGIVHAGIGKISFSDSDLLKNVKAFIESVINAKPSGTKGIYLKKIHMSSTMGPSFRVDL